MVTRRLPAIDGKHVAGNKGRLVGAKKHDGVGDLVGSPTRPSGTVEMRPPFFRIAGKRLSIPVSVAPCYCVNANARTGDLERRGLREPLDGVLAGA